MEAKLVQFIESIETLSDIRNLDPINPIAVIIEHPTNAAKYTIIAAIIEPSYMGIPIHTTWIVLDSNNTYYKKALKLMSSNSPTPSVGILGFNATWVEISTYDSIFEDPQYYTELSGPPGPQGPKGDPGLVYRDQWQYATSYDIGNIVYFYGSSYVSKVANNQFNNPEISPTKWGILAKAGEDYTGQHTLVSIGLDGLNGPIYEGQVLQATVTAYYADGSSRNVTKKTFFSVDTPNVLSIDEWGLVTANLIDVDTQATVTASYTENSITRTDDIVKIVWDSTIQEFMIEAPDKVFLNTEAQCRALARFNSGVVKELTEDCTWNVYQGLDECTIEQSGLFTSGGVSTTGSILAQYIDNGQTFTAYKSIVVTELVTIYPFYGTALENSEKNSTFILNLPNRGPNTDRLAQFVLDGGSLGSGLSMFYAYPVIYGLATFTDLSNNLEGGWDGAAGDPANNPGPIVVPVLIGNMQIDFYLYQTDYSGLGVVQWSVT